MTNWPRQDLDAIGAADELGIAALRPDGTLRPYTTIWVVRVGDALYARSYRGEHATWYQAVRSRPQGRIRAGTVERDASFEHPAGGDDDAIDAAYRSKYGRYGGTYVDPMIASAARATTVRLNPARTTPTTEGHS